MAEILRIPITIERVKADLQAGKIGMIYYSSRTLWWTHLEEDLKEATEQGHKLISIRHQKIMSDPMVPIEQKNRMGALANLFSNSPVRVPTDPTGAPLLQTEDVKNWIEGAELKEKHFGKHGIKAFMKAHHQNCGGLCYTTWKEYNDSLEIN